MLGWKRPEGFDIRAALRHRRERLRQRVLDAGRSGGRQIRAAGAAMVAVNRAAGAAVSGGARTGLRAVGFGAQRIFGHLAAMGSVVWQKLSPVTAPVWRMLRTATEAVWQKLSPAMAPAWRMLRTKTEAVWQKLRTITGPVWENLYAATGAISQKLRSGASLLLAFLARPTLASLAAAVGVFALGAGIGRYRGAGYDSEVVAMVIIGGVLIAPSLLMALFARVPLLAARPARVALATTAVAVLAAGTVWFAYRHLGTSAFSSLTGSKEVVGRASVVAGDLLRVGPTTVRLSGIEAPEREQRCGTDANKWRCAVAAQSALVKIVGNRPVRCSLGSNDQVGRPLGYCWMDHIDINAELVRQGYAFAESGMFPRYGAQEREARNAKAGMWIAEAQRPGEFRIKVWDEARRRAPDGCPIKGRVTGGERVYVLPGAPDYDRVRVLASRGDRWFCSERDAASAGFKAAQGG